MIMTEHSPGSSGRIVSPRVPLPSRRRSSVSRILSTPVPISLEGTLNLKRLTSSVRLCTNISTLNGSNGLITDAIDEDDPRAACEVDVDVDPDADAGAEAEVEVGINEDDVGVGFEA
jgi:hypothetical protein